MHFQTQLEIYKGAVNIDAEENVLSVTCDSEYEVRMKVSSVKDAMRWVPGSKLLIGPTWKCTNGISKYYIVRSVHVVGENEILFETMPSGIASVIKKGRIKVNYSPPLQEKTVMNLMSSGRMNFSEVGKWKLEGKSYEISTFVITPSVSFYVPFEIDISFSTFYTSPFVKLHHLVFNTDGNTEIDCSFVGTRVQPLNKVFKLIEQALPPIIINIFSINPILKLEFEFNSKAGMKFSYKN